METQRKTVAKPIPHDRDPRRWLLLAIVQCASLMGILDGFIVRECIWGLYNGLPDGGGGRGNVDRPTVFI